MRKYVFSPAERYAVYLTHDEKCYMCGRPLDMLTMEVDHVIPETLLDDPIRLKKEIMAHGLPVDFDVNSFANWLPSCGPCNGRKLKTVFLPSPQVQLNLQRAASRMDVARRRAARIVSEQSAAKAINVLQRLRDAGDLEGAALKELQALILPLVAFQERERTPEMVGKPIHFTPLFEVISQSGGLRVIKGPYGVGAGPLDPNAHSSFTCSVCGFSAWSGPRCVICGNMDDD